MAKTKAEIQADWRAKRAAKPLLAQLGYPELETPEMEAEARAIQSDIQKVEDRAERLNVRKAEALASVPASDARTRAEAALTKTRVVRLKVF